MEQHCMGHYHKTLHELFAAREQIADLEDENKHVYSNIESALIAMSKGKHDTAERLLQDLITDRH